MKAEERAFRRDTVPPVRAARSSIVAGAVRRVPQRLRERRFWVVQALVLLITALHWVLESTEALGEHEALSFVPVSFYFIPIVYAGLNFGMEGALPTALWSAALALPNVFAWHAGLQRFGELLQLAIMVSIAIVVARRVDEETTQRRRAEKTSADLKLLNEVGETLSNTLEVEQQLPQVVRSLLLGLSLESVWLCLEPESHRPGSLTTVEASTPGAPSPTDLAQDLHRRLESGQGPLLVDDRSVVVPLLGEKGMLGSLGAKAAEDGGIAGGPLDLLTTVARQVQVALENARLYRQRQESLQSYARQVTQAQEDERLRIARELHDETAQELVLLSRKLEQLKSRVAPDQVQDIDGLLTMTRGTIQAVRRYSRDLRPSVLDDLGLRAAIEMVVEDTGHQLLKGARLQVTGRERRLDGPLELALFRIAQEALRNVEKHSAATMATVDLHFGGDEITLSVADDGHGFSPATNMSDLIRSGRLGLVGMKERAELVGGTFELRSDREGGTRVAVRVKTVSP
ncbi:MAG: sensor histidine kinase [Dehalococcoidia bacterium]|nr:sensor histidine kinase [Dehalococcoidia bacterium]